jgi:hypothetical protein
MITPSESNSMPEYSTLKMEGAHSSEKSANFYQVRKHLIAEGSDLSQSQMRISHITNELCVLTSNSDRSVSVACSLTWFQSRFLCMQCNSHLL